MESAQRPLILPGLLLAACAMWASVAHSASPAGASATSQAPSLPAPPARAPSFAAGLAPFLEAHCAECHGDSHPKGGLDLGPWLEGPANFQPKEHQGPLERVRERLLLGEMPPRGRRPPPTGDVDRALDWIEAALDRTATPRPSLRRLNATQYERTVQDLFGVHYDARGQFPPDDVGQQFDNDAAVASASELSVERWVDAALDIAALALPSLEASTRRTFDAAALESDGKSVRREDLHAMYSASSVSARVVLPRRGRYRIEVRAFGDRAGDELPQLALELDGREAARREVRAERKKPQKFDSLELTATLEAGPHEVGARFVNDYYDEKHPDKGRQDRNAYVSSIEVVGPLDPAPDTAFTRFVDGELARGGFAKTLAAVGLRVWRRPLSAEELARLEALSHGDSAPGGRPRAGSSPHADTAAERERLRTALAALLASPNFLYRVETPAPGEALTDFELATRLSYFLWAGPPDAALLREAAAGRLVDPKVLLSETHRMLLDARASSLAQDFAAQWLGWRALRSATPDLRTFPEADRALLDSMVRESEAFFEAMLRENRPLDQFLRADFAFVDGRLAKHYGIPGVEGPGLQRVHVDDGERGGLLRQASLLAVTSNPTRTSPVKRGKWILETLLGSSVPPPPPGVGVLEEAGGAGADLSLRERLELHRSLPECASCHARLDPLGFALEGFDAVGRRRSDEEGRPLDARGVLADGTPVDGVESLERVLLESGAFPRALARALFSYAMGRAAEREELRHLGSAVDALPAEARTLGALIEIVVRMPAFARAEGTP
ncbi:MAG: DUF1592 domain-containing protein [Planctomycetes bacterium]|nr:DUF1592 domain-containing protein [Planctomycetota bacterium]